VDTSRHSSRVSIHTFTMRTGKGHEDLSYCRDRLATPTSAHEKEAAARTYRQDDTPTQPGPASSLLATATHNGVFVRKLRRILAELGWNPCAMA
jgi:hypothetical protein